MRYFNFLFYFWAMLMLLSFSACRYQTIKTYSDTGDLQEKYRAFRRTKQMHGLYELFYINKQVAIRRYFKKGVEEGEELIFHPNGQLEKRATFVNGLHEGAFFFYFDDGKLHQEGTHKNDRIQGNLKTYYRTGELKEIVAFDKGEENGEIIEYYRNGKIKSEGRLWNGDNRDGLYKIYSEEGELIQKQQCDKGNCITIWTIGDK